MAGTNDTSNAIVRPPIALAIAFVAGLIANWLYPLPVVTQNFPAVWTGAAVFAAGLALGIWAVVTIRNAGSRVETTQPTSTIISHGPYGFTRNPIYVAMLLNLAGLAIGFDSLWILAAIVPFYFVIRYGVVAREEVYLERKFGEVYLGYKSRVRRWI
jgi:protein-S-isoprenylcysteine O-methyltransferase Ste14